MNWTESKINKLKELWEQGIKATEIAERIKGGTTKNSVIAKARRLGCSQRNRSPIMAKTMTKYQLEHFERKVMGIKQPRTTTTNNKPKEIPSSAIAEPEDPTLLEDLTNDQCRYPLWEDNEPKLFCGRTTYKHHSYCGYHVWITTKPKETT